MYSSWELKNKIMKKIRIEVATTESLREKAYSFFSERIFESYGNSPSPLDSKMEILVALKDEKIIGTIGLFFGNSNQELPHNKLYSFLDQDLPENTNLCFISRWAANENNAGLILSYISAKYILSKNTLIGLCILKPRVATYLNSISSNSWNHIIGSALKEEGIQYEDKNYFSSIPVPQLYKANISLYIKSLSNNSIIKDMMKDVEVKIT